MQTSTPWFGVGTQILSPRVVTDVDLGGRVEGVDAGFAVSAENDGADVAGPHAVVLDQVDQAAEEFVAGEVHVDAIDARGVEQALHVFRRAKNGRTGGQRVATNSFKHRRAVVHHVRHDVEGGVVPGNELAVMPDLVGLLNGHADSFASYLVRFAEADGNSETSGENFAASKPAIVEQFWTEIKLAARGNE